MRRQKDPQILSLGAFEVRAVLSQEGIELSEVPSIGVDGSLTQSPLESEGAEVYGKGGLDAGGGCLLHRE